MRPERAIGVAGTVTTLAALDLGLGEYDPERVHGHRLSREGVRRAARAPGLAAARGAPRAPGLDPDRAPVIVAGVVDRPRGARHYGLDGLEASERDILHGAALAAAELPEPEEGDGAARRLHLLLSSSSSGSSSRRRLVLGQPALE